LHGEVRLEELQIRDELLILRHFKALEVLLLEELEHNRLLMGQLLLCELFLDDFVDADSGEGCYWVERFNEFGLGHREHCQHVRGEGILFVFLHFCLAQNAETVDIIKGSNVWEASWSLTFLEGLYKVTALFQQFIVLYNRCKNCVDSFQLLELIIGN
jgi:hypothetical protein